MSIPITLIVDDPAPLINVYWWHVAEVQATGNPRQRSGEPVVRDVPVDFLRRFCDVVARRKIRGKFSVIPYPAGLGPINEGWHGSNSADMNTWIDLVRCRIAPQMDITPEILTHAKALDLNSHVLLPENERSWSQQQTAVTMTPYIAYSLEILNSVGLPASGVTSPWDFGIEVEDEYQVAIRQAMATVNGRLKSWYFLHQDNETTDFRSRLVHRREETWQVSVCSQVADGFWRTMESPVTSPDYVRSVADAYLSEDGCAGRLAELFAAGTPMVCCTHWQSLFSNGRATGLQALDEVGRRIQVLWGEEVEWITCSVLAANIAGDCRKE